VINKKLIMIAIETKTGCNNGVPPERLFNSEANIKTIKVTISQNNGLAAK
jgi:hypothetical protein